MNRLWVRLSLAFIAITLVGVISVAVLVDITASQAFRQYVARQGIAVQSGMLDTLAIFYQQHNTWNGVREGDVDAPPFCWQIARDRLSTMNRRRVQEER
jgi:Tfp pilus assembly protein PilE